MAKFVIMLGPPGSGKGTQAKLLAKHFDIAHVSTGELFRAMKTQETELAKRVQEIIARGDLVSDEVTNEIVSACLDGAMCECGAVLDGYPRNTGQADALTKMLYEKFGKEVEVALELDVPEEVIVRRIVARAEKENRPDDTEEVARKRFEIYMAETAPLIEYYGNKDLLEKIDGDRGIELITPDLIAAVEKRTE